MKMKKTGRSLLFPALWCYRAIVGGTVAPKCRKQQTPSVLSTFRRQEQQQTYG
jgi:hypothetical protein